MKRFYTSLINIYDRDDKQKLKVFDRNGVCLSTKKVDKVTEAVIKVESEQTKVRAGKEPVTVKNEPIPEIPKKSELASKYLRLADIYNKLEKQNAAIYQREQQLDCVEKELAGAKGIFKGKQRKKLQEQMEQLITQIAGMKQY